MPTIYATDGDADTIISGVGLTVLDYTEPNGNYAVFGDIAVGFQRRVHVRLDDLNGLLSGAGMIGYFSEAALAKPRPGGNVPLLVELVALGPDQKFIVPPLARHSPDSIAGRVSPSVLTIEEQQALFVRVLGKDWARQVERHVTTRAAAMVKD